MMKKIMLAALGATCIASGLYAGIGTSATGFFVEGNLGGSYNQIKEYYKHDKQDKKDMTEILEASKKFAMFLGGGLGYGYEFSNGFYVGGKAYALYNFAKIEKEAPDETNSKKISGTIGNELKTVNIKGSYNIEVKPSFSYGASIQVGYKVVPNVLVYVGLGGEGTYTKAKQFIEFDACLLKQGNIKTSKWSSSVDTPTFAPGSPYGICDFWVDYKEGGNEDLKINTFAVVPEVGFKFFLSSNMFVGGNVTFPIGFKKKMDEKYYNKAIKVDYISKEEKLPSGDDKHLRAEGVTVMSLKELGITPYFKNSLNVRYGISFGYKF